MTSTFEIHIPYWVPMSLLMPERKCVYLVINPRCRIGVLTLRYISFDLFLRLLSPLIHFNLAI
jgi:hypothetical protein